MPSARGWPGTKGGFRATGAPARLPRRGDVSPMPMVRPPAVPCRCSAWPPSRGAATLLPGTARAGAWRRGNGTGGHRARHVGSPALAAGNGAHPGRLGPAHTRQLPVRTVRGCISRRASLLPRSLWQGAESSQSGAGWILHCLILRLCSAVGGKVGRQAGGGTFISIADPLLAQISSQTPAQHGLSSSSPYGNMPGGRHKWRCRHGHFCGPDSASAARGGPRPHAGPSVQRLPSGDACFLWKTKRAGTLRSAVPLPNACLLQPCCGPTASPSWDQGTPRLSTPRISSVSISWGHARGWHAAPRVLGHPEGCPVPGGPAWLRGGFARPLPPVCNQPPCNNGDASEGNVLPRCPVPWPRRQGMGPRGCPVPGSPSCCARSPGTAIGLC